MYWCCVATINLSSEGNLMAFGIFSKNKNNQQNEDSGKVASLFKKIRLNVNQTSGKTINRDFDSEPSFGQVNQNYASIDPTQGNPGQNVNSQDQFSSAFSDPGFTNIVPPQNLEQKLQTSDFDLSNSQGLSQPNTQTHEEETIYAVGPSERELKKHDYYTYKANEAYLNEEGRDSGHLYIAPGEPLRPRKPKAEVKQEEEKTPIQTDLFSNNTMVQGDIPAHITTEAKQNSQNTAPVNEDKPTVNTSVKENTVAVQNTVEANNPASNGLAKPSFENTTQSNPADNQINQQATFANNQQANVGGSTAQSSIFANVKNTNLNFGPLAEQTNNSEPNFNQNAQVQPNVQAQQQVPNEHLASDTQIKVNNEISGFVYVLVFLRQLVASFFNFTNLGALFPKQALSILGPSAPAFMPLPYFVIGLITCALAMFMQSVCQSYSLCAAVVTMFFFALTGSGAFRGIGHLCTAISLRKIDTYGKILITLIVISLFARSIQYFSKYMELDFYFCLGFAVIFMLSSFTATTLNFGSSDDPVSSFGTLGLKGLIAGTIISLAITFVVLDWQIALTMLGICLLCRVLIGQFMVVKGIKASTDMVCALQLITAILLMLELIFTNGYFTFINPALLG